MVLAGILLLSAGAAVSGPVSEWPSAGFIVEKARHGVVIRGHLPSSRARDALLSDAGESGIPVVSTEYSRHIVLPDWWSSAVQAMVPAASILESGEIRLSRSALSLHGVVREDERWAAALSSIHDALPDGVRFSNQVAAISDSQRSAICDALFNSLDLEPLLFRRRSSLPKTEDYGRLNRLAATLRNCPDIAVRIVGHSDAFGITSRNQVVSEQRGESVAKYLVARGVADNQLKWEGRGDREPAATNNTWEGRNLNRRVTIDRLD